MGCGYFVLRVLKYGLLKYMFASQSGLRIEHKINI